MLSELLSSNVKAIQEFKLLEMDLEEKGEQKPNSLMIDETATQD